MRWGSPEPQPRLSANCPTPIHNTFCFALLFQYTPLQKFSICCIFGQGISLMPSTSWNHDALISKEGPSVSGLVFDTPLCNRRLSNGCDLLPLLLSNNCKAKFKIYGYTIHQWTAQHTCKPTTTNWLELDSWRHVVMLAQNAIPEWSVYTVVVRTRPG